MIGDVEERFIVGRFWLGGAQTLSGLSHVSFQVLDLYRTIFCRVCISEAWPGGKVARFDVRKQVERTGNSAHACK